MSTIRLVLGLMVAFVALALVPATASAANCKLTANEEYNRSNKGAPTYTRSLTVSGGASCGTAHKMVRSFYSCRVKAPSTGLKGRCTKKVLGYSCSERRKNDNGIQFDSTVSCKKGRARIGMAYTQFVKDPRK